MAEIGKRPRPDDDDDDGRRSAEQRKVRFPKGKKVKDEGLAAAKRDDDLDSLINPDVAAKKRAKRRKHTREDEVHDNASNAEIRYEENVNFVEDGIQIEPFNLENEREEGYFDQDGNYVEFARENQIKDAWLDSAEIDTNLASKLKKKSKEEDEEEFHDLSSDDIGKIKRNIANILQPGETIIQALKRLKGTTDKRTKMSDETKELFDQLTESAMKLMENGEYNAYHEERETFEREAEGYERLARLRGGESTSAVIGDSILSANGEDDKTGEGSVWNVVPPAAEVPTNKDDDDGNFDMFGDENENIQDDNNNNNKQNDANLNGTDYEYDPSSGYYYSSSLGYYYDASSGLYCCASTGIWYSFDEQSGTYEKVENASSQTSN